MTTIIIFTAIAVFAPVAVNGIIAYFRSGAPAQEVKTKEVKLAPANPWKYVGSKETDYTASSTFTTIDNVPVCDTAVDSVNEVPQVDVTPVVLTQDAQDPSLQYSLYALTTLSSYLT